MGPLSHLRVLDLSRVLAGPWCTQMLADLGADVIKIEKPGVGDDTRHWGPPFIAPDVGSSTNTKESAYFLGANRGKRSVAVDIADPSGQQIIRELVSKSDVLVENFKVGGLKKYGLDYDTLSATYPSLVYCSITGFGQTGPYANRAGYDFMIQGLGGLMSITGEKEEGENDSGSGGGPQKVGVAITDIVTGLYASSAIQAALIGRAHTGIGQHIDVSLMDCQVAVLANQAMNYLSGDIIPKRLGNAHPNIVPYQVFQTNDSYIILAIGNDKQFNKFCVIANCLNICEDLKYKRNQDRVINRTELIQKLEPIMRIHTTKKWLTLLENEGIPCGPINNIKDALNDPQIIHREMRIKSMHSSLGEIELLNSPLKLSRTPVEVSRAPPTLGQHTNDVLKEVLGYSESQLEQLRGSGVIRVN